MYKYTFNFIYITLSSIHLFLSLISSISLRQIIIKTNLKQSKHCLDYRHKLEIFNFSGVR